MRSLPTLLSLAMPLVTSMALAQHPFRHPADALEARHARSHPVVGYTLRVDSADLTGFEVEMRIRSAPDTFRLAMAAHPEYDDRYWRFVDGLRASDGATIARLDSSLWRVVAPRRSTVIRYRLRLPPAESPRAAWRPFLAPTGGFVGGPHSFMYIVGAELGPSHVVLELPASWTIATALIPTSDSRTFFAPTVDVLVDSPMLVGQLRSWRFTVDDAPYRVAYWPLPDATPFDTLAFVRGVEGIARQASSLFGRAPFREYTFLFQDGAFGGLEYVSSASLGAPSANLAEGLADHLGEAAHEYIHAWNLVRIRPVERGAVSYVQTGQSRGLWWSEGLTLFYSDLLMRRAGIPLRDSTRAQHVERLLARYLGNPGNTRIDPERASLAEYGTAPGSLGDYDPSVHAQGEVIGTMLDLMIRDATGGRRSMDDVMRLMMERFSGERGFTGADIERTVRDVCSCDVASFFRGYVRSAGAVNVDHFLRLIGMRAVVTRIPALDRDGQPSRDLRIFAWQPSDGERPRVLINDPESIWGRAGLHTNDQLVSVNGAAIGGVQALRVALFSTRMGDTVRVEVLREGRPWVASVVIRGYDRPSVRLEEIAGATDRQRRLRELWLAGR